jgi:hypothetical protein
MKQPSNPWKWVAFATSGVAILGWGLVLFPRALPEEEQVSSSSTVASQPATGTKAFAEKQSKLPLTDDRTIALFEKLQALREQAVAGQPNEGLIKVMDWILLSPDMHRRQRNFSLLLEQLRPEDAPLLHKFFQKLHREGRPFEENLLSGGVR